MQKIRIKKAPKPGDQQDYSLVGRNVSFTNSGEGTSNVKNTMGAVPVEKANIEVEGGETVVGDINNDGFLEQFTFVGKRHSQGGMPVNIPEGSFIFSDTKKLKIKDKELLESVFGLKEKKGGYTPAEIAKKYQINQFVQDLKSEDTDAIQKRSAAEMLKKNTQKLGMLALVQESMKGFPDGIPAIAESVMAGLQGAQIPGMEKGEGVAHEVMEGSQEMKYGGAMKKFQDGGFDMNFTPNTIIYVNGVPFKYESHSDAQGWFTGDNVVFRATDGTGRYYKTNTNTLEDRIDSGKAVDLGFKDGRTNKAYITSKPGKSYYDSGKESFGDKSFSAGQKFYANGKQYEVIDPYSSTSSTFYSSSGASPTVGVSTGNSQRTINVPALKVYQLDNNGKRVGDPTYLKDYDIRKSVTEKTFDYVGTANVAAAGTKAKQVQGNPFKIDAISGMPTAQTTKINAEGKGDFQYAKDAAGAWWYYNNVTGGMGKVAGESLDVLNAKKQPPASNTPPAKTTPAPKTNTAPRPAAGSKPKTAQDALNYFASGGSVLNQYQTAGPVQGGPGGPQQTQPGTLNTTVATQQQAQAAGNQRVDPNKEIFVGDITLEDGTVVKAYYKGNQKYVKDVNGNILASGPRTDTKFEQYGSTNINKILSSSPNVLYTETNFGSFNNQPGFKQSGIYLSSGNQNARQSGDLSPEEWADFQRRHGDWIDRQYTGGFAQFQKDLRTGRATGDKAAGWFQDAVNEKSMAQAGVPYFAPLGQGKKEDNPYYRDSKFGQVTYSVPRFFDAPKPPEQPGDEVAYFCVEYTNGVKDVVSVSHKAGEQPVAPSGSNIKAVSAASKDKGTVEGQCINVPEKQGEKQPVKEGPWWIQDIVNYVGTQTDQVNRYEPVQAKIDTYTPGYDLLDPTRKLAANQEQMARYQSQVENTADGNVGLATVLGATGEGFANAANVLDTTEAANIGIVNAAYDKNAAIQNQEIVGNETARVKYVEDMATLNQQYDDALKQKKWREIAAFNNGTSNWFRKKQTENVLFPQVYIDPIFGDVEFTGRGRQVFGDEGTAMAPDVYQNPMYGGKGGVGSGYDPSAITQTSNAAWKKAYDEALPLRGEEGARNHADAVSKMYLQTARQNPTWQQGFQNAYMNGMTMPASFNATPWDDDPNN